MKFSIPRLAGLLMLSLSATLSVAQDNPRSYPTHPIKLVVPFPAGDMKEWIAEIRRNPGKYSYASSGSGSPHHIFMSPAIKASGATAD